MTVGVGLAFCSQGLQRIEDESAWLRKISKAEEPEKKTITKMADLDTFTRDKFGYTLDYTQGFCLIVRDMVWSIPIIAQIVGIAHILEGRDLLHNPERTPGWHSAGKGCIVRGVLECLNLGPVLLVSDIIASIAEPIIHKPKTPQTKDVLEINATALEYTLLSKSLRDNSLTQSS